MKNSLVSVTYVLTTKKNTKSLTSDEIDKVKKAVAEANKDKGITEADVTVAEDGTVTVTKDGKTGTLEPAKTVKQKEVQNNFNPPKEPVKVENKNSLTTEEKQAVKDAIKAANPDRNFTNEDITVNDDGSVKINQGGKVGTIPADKTVVQKDTILDLTPPDKTEVKDTTDLTKAERDKVAAAVKDKNSLPDTAKIEVDSKGNVTVTNGAKTGTLEGKDTVKPFTRDGKKLNPPATKVKVGDTNKLTEAEKQAVRDEIKKANPELGFTDDEIQVDPNGTVTVPMGKNEASIPAEETVEQAKDTDKTIKLVAPAKTEVADKTKLTQEEKKAVEEAVKKANTDLPQDATVTVAEDGSVTVTQGKGENQKVGQLSQADTVLEKLKAPTVEAVDDGSVKVLPNNKESDTLEISFGDPATIVTATKGADGNWALADGTDPSIKIDKETGTVTIPASKLSKKEEVKAKEKAGEQVSPEATVNSNDTTAPEKPAVKVEDNGSVTVTPPTDADTKSVTIAYKDKDGHDQTLVATKGDDGKWTLPAGTDTSIKIDEATGAVTLPKDKIKAGEKVTAKAKDANDNESAEGEATPVDKTKLQEEVDKNNDDAIKNSDKYKNADQTKKDAYDSALDKANKVLGDPNAEQKDVNDALQQLKEAEKALDGKTDTTAPQAPKVEAKDNGDVVVTPPTDANLKSVTIEYTDPQGNKKTVIATKDGNAWTFNPSEAGFTIDASGDIVIPKDQVKPGTVVSATAKNTGDKESTTGSAKVPSLADKYTPEYTEADGGVGTKSTITGPNFKDAKGQDTTKPANTTFELGQDAPTGAAVDANGTVTYTPTEADKGKTITIPVVVNYSDGSSETVNATIAVAGENINKPTAPTVVANEDGSVTVTPSNTDANTKQLEVTYTPEGATDPVTVKATKDANGWTLPSGVTDVSIDPQTGVITIQADKVADNTEVKAVAKDSTGVNTSDEAKANAKARVDKKPLEAEINDEHKTKADVKYKNASAVKKKAYDDALAEAKRIFADPNATQEEVNKAKDALTAAKKALDGTTSGGTTPTPTPKPGGTTPTPRPGETTEESPKRTTDRTKGRDRVETAIEISKKYFRHANTVIVVDRKDFPDAMTASVLSKLLKAPILLTDTNKLDPRVAAEIQRLGAKDVIIVGGNKSVSEAVKKELAKFDKDTVERIYGRDRYETSAQVARRVVGITGKTGHAVVASGEVFADALAVAPYASREGYPILLVRANNLPKSVKDAITELAINRVTIAGGYITVNKSLEASLPTVVERLSGRTRYETAIAIADKKFSGSKETFLANGEHWMDALVIGPVGAISDRPILLTPANNAPKSLKDYIAKSKIEKITAIGGTSMVSGKVLNELSK